MRYVYSMIRFVPDPARGEFVNVGAVVGSDDSAEWKIRPIENFARARAFGRPDAIKAVSFFVDRVQSDLDREGSGTETISEEWLGRLHNNSRNVVQLSWPATVAADSADHALERVFATMIVQQPQRRYPTHSKKEAYRGLLEAYEDELLRKGQDLRQRVELQSNSFATNVDFAVTNGRTLQLAQAWSFQIADQNALTRRIKAWGWTIHNVREAGGIVTDKSGSIFRVSANVDLEVVYIPPVKRHENSALNEAMSVFHRLDVQAVELRNVADVAAKARRLIVQKTSVMETATSSGEIATAPAHH